MKGRRRFMGGEEPFDGFLVRGKFADESGPEDWVLRYGSFGATPINIAEYVNPETKEFEYRREKISGPLGLFYQLEGIERIDEIRGSEMVTAFQYTFSSPSIVSVNLQSLSYDSCTSLNSMFYSATKLANIEIGVFDAAKITSFDGMFRDCKALTTLRFTPKNSSKNQTLTRMFYGCSSLLDLHIELDCSNVTSTTSAFAGCISLKNVTGSISNLKTSLNINASPLTAESAQVFIDGLSPEGAGQTISFSIATNKLLSEEQKQQIAEKGWILA